MEFIFASAADQLACHKVFRDVNIGTSPSDPKFLFRAHRQVISRSRISAYYFRKGIRGTLENTPGQDARGEDKRQDRDQFLIHESGTGMGTSYDWAERDGEIIEPDSRPCHL